MLGVWALGPDVKPSNGVKGVTRMTIPLDVTKATEQLEAWVLDLQARAMLGSVNQSFPALRAVLQEVRDRVTVDDALRLADALPALARGVMLEKWHPQEPNLAADCLFLDAVRARLAGHHAPPDSIVDDVLGVLARHVYPQHLPVLTAKLPAELQTAWRSALEKEHPAGR
jgi:uncharacterized protein (DUF2267 family)